LLEYIHQ